MSSLKANNTVKVLTFTFIAKSEITKYYPVFQDATDTDQVAQTTSANAARCMGVAQQDAEAGEAVSVMLIGICPVIADTAVALNDQLISEATTGYAAAAPAAVGDAGTTENNVFGMALGAAPGDGTLVLAAINAVQTGTYFSS